MPRSLQRQKRKKSAQPDPISTVPKEVKTEIQNIIASVDSSDTDVSEKRVVKRLVKRLKVDLDLSVQHEELTELLNDDDANAMQVFLFERYTQCIKAKRVFEMLDEADKGVVVVQDLQRVADEIFEGDESLSESDLQEMMDLVDESGDGLLTKENLIQIAQMVGL